MKIRSLEDGEQDACLDLWDAAFEDTPRSYFEKYFKDPGWKLEDTVVCEEAGRLVSAVHTVRRTVETREGRKGMAGIANVGTHPDFRGRGLSTACLEETHRRLEADPFFDFGLLGTGIHDFYARLGWQRWEFHGWEGRPRHFMGQFIAWFIGEASETALPTIQELYAAQNHGQPLAVVRDDTYWREWLGWKPDGWHVGVGGREGYAHVRESGDVLVVTERGGDFALEQLLSTSPHARLLFPLSRAEAEALLEDPQPCVVPWWMVRPVQGKPLPDLTDGFFYDADGF
jgi:predicted N-acetyltransferase YhbS